MKINTVPDFSRAIAQHLSQEWLDRYHDFLAASHFNCFQSGLIHLMIKGQPENRLPFYQEEIHIDLKETISFFRKLYATQLTVEDFTSGYAQMLMNVPFRHLLAIMGQRFTESSHTDETALPPEKQTLIQSGKTPYNNEITVARRSWEKHLGRGHTDFWGAMKGDNTRKEKQVRQLVEHIIDNASWWNVFHHYKHGPVYEIRIPNGNGIRWNKEGTVLIGFLEPFLAS